MKYFLLICLFMSGCSTSLQNICAKKNGMYIENSDMEVCHVSKGNK